MVIFLKDRDIGQVLDGATVIQRFRTHGAGHIPEFCAVYQDPCLYAAAIRETKHPVSTSLFAADARNRSSEFHFDTGLRGDAAEYPCPDARVEKYV